MRKIFLSILLLIIFFTARWFPIFHESEFSLMQENWKIALSEKPSNEIKLLDTTGGITGDGLKIIKFQYDSNQIKSIKKDFTWSDYNEVFVNKFGEFKFFTLNEKDIYNIYYDTVETINNDLSNNKFFLLEDDDDFLILVLNSKLNELTAFINY